MTSSACALATMNELKERQKEAFHADVAACSAFFFLFCTLNLMLDDNTCKMIIDDIVVAKHLFTSSSEP